jgi:hypothetical protein
MLFSRQRFSLVNGTSDGTIALIYPGESCATGNKLPFTNGKSDRLAHPFESFMELLGLFTDIAEMLALCCPGENTGRGDLVNGIEGRPALAFDPDENFALQDCLADSSRLSRAIAIADIRCRPGAGDKIPLSSKDMSEAPQIVPIDHS